MIERERLNLNFCSCILHLFHSGPGVPKPALYHIMVCSSLRINKTVKHERELNGSNQRHCLRPS